MTCAAERFVLNLLATCVSAADKKLAHPNNLNIQTIVCDTIHEDKIKYSPPSYPEEGMTQEHTMHITDFDVASCKHAKHTNNILNVAELTDVFTKKYFREKEELTKVVKAKRDVVHINKSKTYAMEVRASMEEEIQGDTDRPESEEVRCTAQTTLLLEHVKTWGTTQQTLILNKYEEKKKQTHDDTNKRMLVTLEKHEKSEKKTTFAAGKSSIKAPLKFKDGKPIISCRRLKLETDQVANDAIYSCASNVMNVRIKNIL
jgi:hypothetical protein